MRVQVHIAVLCMLAACWWHATGAATSAASTFTQAGCACLESWESPLDGSKQQGCQNPNSDPQGAWCAVDANSCPGFFGVVVGSNGQDVHYDYCDAVRETTQQGCLCQSVWALPGGNGKKYKARCAQPGSPTERVCVANPTTCPHLIGVPEVQSCAAVTDKPADGNTTANGCSCAAGWGWTYKDGSTQEFTACANPDGDPLGPWCQVDAMACDQFAGQVNATGRIFNFDYCQTVKAPVSNPGTCTQSIPHYQQCGGKSNCTDWGCSDAQWTGACCEAKTPALRCHRQNQFYHQCLNSEDVAMLKNGSAIFEPPDVFIIINNTEKVAPAPSSPASPQLPVSPVPVDVQTPLPALKLPGTQVLLTLRINYDFSKLAVFDAMAAFKAALVAWLTSIAGPPEYVYNVSVTRVAAGSVVADATITFTANAPRSIVDAVINKLNTTGSELYAASGLSSTYGPMISLLMSAGPAIPIPNAPTAQATGAVGSIGAGAVGGIVVAAVAVLAGAGFAVSRALATRVPEDADKNVQLEYMNELTEAEIAAQMAAAGKLRQEELDLPRDFAPNARSSSWLNEWLGELPTPNPNQVARHPSLGKASFSIRTVPNASTAHTAFSNFSGNPPEYASSNGRLDVSDLAGTPRSHISAEPVPESAFLPMPDGETATKGGAGIAFASLKHRRISNSSQPGSPAVGGRLGASQPSSPALGSREQGAPQLPVSHTIADRLGASPLGMLGSVVSSYVGGSSGATPQDDKKQ